jgi:hypothetical protein
MTFTSCTNVPSRMAPVAGIAFVVAIMLSLKTYRPCFAEALSEEC